MSGPEPEPSLRAQQVDQDVAEKFGFAAAGRALQREVAALGVQANPGLLDFVTDGLFEWGSAQLKCAWKRPREENGKEKVGEITLKSILTVLNL